MLTIGLASAHALHLAVLNGDRDHIDHAYDKYDAVVWALNGGTFRHDSDPEGGRTLVERCCESSHGEEPLWFQRGAFLVTVHNTRCVVETRAGFSRYFEELTVHAVDLDQSFLSNAGYKTLTCGSHFGCTVRDMANIAIRNAIALDGLAPITAHCEDPAARWPWLRTPAAPDAIEATRAAA